MVLYCVFGHPFISENFLIHIFGGWQNLFRRLVVKSYFTRVSSLKLNFSNFFLLTRLIWSNLHFCFFLLSWFCFFCFLDILVEFLVAFWLFLVAFWSFWLISKFIAQLSDFLLWCLNFLYTNLNSLSKIRKTQKVRLVEYINISIIIIIMIITTYLESFVFIAYHHYLLTYY